MVVVDLSDGRYGDGPADHQQQGTTRCRVDSGAIPIHAKCIHAPQDDSGPSCIQRLATGTLQTICQGGPCRPEEGDRDAEQAIARLEARSERLKERSPQFAS